MKGIVVGLGRQGDGRPRNKREESIGLIPLEAEQPWKGDFSILMLNLSWVLYSVEENCKGAEGPN